MSAPSPTIVQSRFAFAAPGCLLWQQWQPCRAAHPPCDDPDVPGALRYPELVLTVEPSCVETQIDLTSSSPDGETITLYHNRMCHDDLRSCPQLGPLLAAAHTALTHTDPRSRWLVCWITENDHGGCEIDLARGESSILGRRPMKIFLDRIPRAALPAQILAALAT